MFVPKRALLTASNPNQQEPTVQSFQPKNQSAVRDEAEELDIKLLLSLLAALGNMHLSMFCRVERGDNDFCLRDLDLVERPIVLSRWLSTENPRQQTKPSDGP